MRVGREGVEGVSGERGVGAGSRLRERVRGRRDKSQHTSAASSASERSAERAGRSFSDGAERSIESIARSVRRLLTHPSASLEGWASTASRASLTPTHLLRPPSREAAPRESSSSCDR